MAENLSDSDGFWTAVFYTEGQVACWLQTLAEFQVTVEHHQEISHSNADALSRRSNSKRHDALAVSTIASSDNIHVWSPQWTKKELQTAQQDDPDLKIVF